ncbi:MAG: putative DNA binding domain-containing protein [Gemmatimonadetes bacterium]|nr:putative DNA binding domain-containing protein [Gemmatimonadota bacterium]
MSDRPLTPRERLLLDRIRLGESSRLDLKAVQFAGAKLKGPDRKTLADELAAFANAHGGALVLGVDDRSRGVVGIPEDRVPEVVTLVRQVCTDSIDPLLHASIEPLRLPSSGDGDRPVVEVRVRRSLFVHRSPSGYLHRVGDEKRRMSTEYLARLFQQRSQSRLIRFDEQTVHEANIGSLSKDLWKRFRTSRTGDARDGLLTKLRMARRDRDGVLRPTVAGVLMASRDPREWLPNAFVQAVAYRGADVRPAGLGRTYQLDAADITGPLDMQVDLACRFVARNMKVAAFKDMGRIDRPQYDMTAVFEALVNAVAHRDYSVRGSKIRLRMFEDRIELYSPGSIPNTITPERLVHLQSARNEVVTSLLAKCPVPQDIPWLDTDRRTLMDRRGEGVRIILENSERLSGREPRYRLIDNAELLLTIHAPRE